MQRIGDVDNLHSTITIACNDSICMPGHRSCGNASEPARCVRDIPSIKDTDRNGMRRVGDVNNLHVVVFTYYDCICASRYSGRGDIDWSIQSVKTVLIVIYGACRNEAFRVGYINNLHGVTPIAGHDRIYAPRYGNSINASRSKQSVKSILTVKYAAYPSWVCRVGYIYNLHAAMPATGHYTIGMPGCSVHGHITAVTESIWFFWDINHIACLSGTHRIGNVDNLHGIILTASDNCIGIVRVILEHATSTTESV